MSATLGSSGGRCRAKLTTPEGDHYNEISPLNRKSVTSVNRIPSRRGGGPLKDGNCDLFQQAVSDYLIRHRSIMDVLSKYQETNARVNRAVAKAVTNCGCLAVHASRRSCSEEMSLEDYRQLADSHLQGELCEHCQEVIEGEIGANLFYLAALCEVLGLDLATVLEKEKNRINTLGVFHLS